MSLVVDEHREYLADDARIGAFRAALRATVQPGQVGLDLASGTGILGLIACQLGASRVYAIESEGIAGLGRALAQENGFGDRIVVIRALSTRTTLPEPVDFIVTDLAGRFGFEAGLIEMLGDARRRFLKPDGTLIPSAVSLWICPVEAADVRAHVDFWSQPKAALTFAAAHAIARSTGYPRALQPNELLSEPALLTTAGMDTDVETLSGQATFTIARPASLDGIGGWFSATLVRGVELTNAPGSANRINRRNVFFPLRETVDTRAGDRVSVSMFIRPDTLLVRWAVQVHRGTQLVHATNTSTFEGMLLGREDLVMSRPEFRPSLTEPGRARRTVVNLCDGRRTIGEIEQAVLAQHPQLFRSVSEAATFVAEVVTRYAE